MASTIPTLEVRNPGAHNLGAQRAQQVTRQVDQKEGQAHRIGYRSLFDAHEVLQTEVLLGIPEGKLNGTIPNDKFCMSRILQLTLDWSRRPLRLRDLASEAQPSS